MKQFFTILFLFFLCNYIAEAQQTPTFADPPGPEHVLVVYKQPTGSTDTLGFVSDSVKEYYKDARQIPESNILGLDSLINTNIYDPVSNTTHRIILDQQGEIIRDSINQYSSTPTIHAWLYFNDRIAKPIANYLKNTYVNGTPLKDIIRFIVLVKGVPFRIDARQEDADSRGTNVICANLLTHLGETMEDPDALLFYYNKTPGITNPYYNKDPNFSMEHRFRPNHYQTTWQGRTIPLSYLVTHLSAPRFEDIKGMIDRSLSAINASDYTWFMDIDPTPCRTVASGDPEPSFNMLNITNYFFDRTEQIYENFDDSIMTYLSNGIWTTVGDPDPCYAWDYFQPDYIQSQLNFDYAAGAFFSSIESHNGLSIGTYPVIRTRDQGLIADFTLMGGTVAVGQALHSTASYVIRNDIFFPSYAVGYTFIEAAYLGLQRLDATNVVVGDPLTIIYNCPETIVSQNTTIGSGNYTCDLVVEENATLTISSSSVINFNRNAKLIVYGTLALEDGTTLNFDKYSRLYIEGNLTMSGNSASLNFNDKSIFRAKDISVDNALTMTFNDHSEFQINEEGVLTTHPDNSFTFNGNSKFYTDGKLTVNSGNSLNFNNSSLINVHNKIHLNAGAEINFNNNSQITVYGTFISQGAQGNNVVFNFSGTPSNQLVIYNTDTVKIDFTTFIGNGLRMTLGESEPLKLFSITNSIFESAREPINLSTRFTTIESPVVISNCFINNCTGTGIWVGQFPEVVIEHNTIELSLSVIQRKGIVIKNNGIVNINDCIIKTNTGTIFTPAEIGIESLVSQTDELEIIEELETDITITLSSFSKLATGILIDNQVAPYEAVNIVANHFDSCFYPISINDFSDYSPVVSDNVLSGIVDGDSETGIMLTNGNQAIVTGNSVANFLTGIYLSNVGSPAVVDNFITAVDLTVTPNSGIFAESCNGEIRKNTIKNHTYGIELGGSSPNVAENTITENLQYGMYISSDSHPDLGLTLIGPIGYPLTGYNNIFENGVCDLSQNPEIFISRSTINLESGCNTIADDREDDPQLNCDFFYLIDGEGVEEEINAVENYWGDHPVYGNDPDGRFGEELTVDFSHYHNQPCTYSQGGGMLLMTGSGGEVYDTVYSSSTAPSELTDIESRYAAANEYYYNHQYSQAKQEYSGIIQNYGSERASIKAYNGLYTIEKLMNSSPESFQQLKSFYLQKAGTITDSLMVSTLTHLSNLCLVSAKEYETAIDNFDEIIQQNPNTDVALYREIDALTTALLISSDSTLGKRVAGKYYVSGTADYNNKVQNLLKNRKSSSTENDNVIIPNEFSLYQNYPNPFNPTTVIRFDIPQPSNVEVTIFDILGRRVKVLVNEVKHPGRYEVSFNANNLPSGVYFYRITAGDYLNTKKMLLIK
jgi:parallel beta-helix repeat protein